MSIPDTILMKAIDAVYMRYDKDHSNTLDKNELVNCFNQLLKMTGSPTMANSFIVGQILKRMDKDGDGRISKPEFMNMFRIFQSGSKNMMGGLGGNQGGMTNQPPPNNGGNWQNQGVFNQGGYNQGGFNQGGYNQGGFNQGGGYGYGNQGNW